MRRNGWRGILVVILAMTMVWALAPGASAKKGGVPGGPGGGGQGSSLVVEVVDVAGNLMFTIRKGDVVYFDVSKDGAAVSGTLVVATANDHQSLAVIGGVSAPYSVRDEDVAGSDFVGTATFGEDVATFEFSVFGPEARCEDVGLASTAYGYTGDFPDGVTCMLELDRAGYMTVGLTASGERNTPTKIFLTMRDNIPGNWCAVDPDSPSGVFGRVRPGEQVLLPSGDPLRWYFPESGICVKGGRGGEMIGDGKPGEFYLVVTGELTLTWEE